MIKRTCLFAFLLTVLYWSIARAQNYPIADTIATKVIQKYQQASCEQLWKEKSEPKPPKVQEAIQALKDNPQMRTAFINKVAPSIANKLFECGMIP